MVLWFVVFGLFWQKANSSGTAERLQPLAKLQVKPKKKKDKAVTLSFRKKQKRVISESLSLGKRSNVG